MPQLNQGHAGKARAEKRDKPQDIQDIFPILSRARFMPSRPSGTTGHPK